jgi:hypothetical protein
MKMLHLRPLPAGLILYSDLMSRSYFDARGRQHDRLLRTVQVIAGHPYD